MIETLQPVAVIAGWVTVGIWGWRGNTLGRWWWAAALLAGAATLGLPATAEALDTAVGLSGLGTGVGHAAVAAAAGLAVRAQLATARPDSTTAARAAGAYLVVVPALLIGTAPTAPGPHQVLYYGALAGAAAVFANTGRAEIRELAPGRPRAVAQLLTTAAAATAAWAGLAAVAAVGPAALHLAAAVGSGGFLAVAATATATGLGLAAVHRRDTAHRADAHAREVLALWNWLNDPDTDPEHPDDLAHGPEHPDDAGDSDRGDRDRRGEDLFGVVIETRDRMWLAQQWVDVDELAAAAHLARRLGLVGTPARAFTAAVCLQLGLSAVEDHAPRPARPADLSGLGGGSTPETEAVWFAAIWRARTEHPCAAAAEAIRAAELSITEPGHGTVNEP